jgi:hypothetical protein
MSARPTCSVDTAWTATSTVSVTEVVNVGGGGAGGGGDVWDDAEETDARTIVAAMTTRVVLGIDMCSVDRIESPIKSV